jgi:dTDP-4-dehydrorhamnose 3,5-epimerase
MKHFGLNLVEQPLSGLLLLEPTVHGDARGYFMETFKSDSSELLWKQDNESMSHRGVLRGLHFQRPPHAQAKLVSVVQGSVYDVVVDLRGGSPTYGKTYGALLSAANKRRLLIPAGFGHGFATLEDGTVFQYRCSEVYAPEAEGCIAYDDADLGIDWLGATGLSASELQLSAKDEKGMAFASFETPFTGSEFQTA